MKVLPYKFQYSFKFYADVYWKKRYNPKFMLKFLISNILMTKNPDGELKYDQIQFFHKYRIPRVIFFRISRIFMTVICHFTVIYFIQVYS